jgi:hypothetical protein
VDVVELKAIFDGIASTSTRSIQEYHDFAYPTSACDIFRPFVVFLVTLDAFHAIFLTTLVCFLGGRVVSDLGDSSLTHLVFVDRFDSRLGQLKQDALVMDGKYRRFVSADWIRQCFQSRVVLPEEAFLV